MIWSKYTWSSGLTKVILFKGTDWYTDLVHSTTRGFQETHSDDETHIHYCDVIMSAIASQITGVSIAYLTFCSGADQRKHQRSASLAFVRGIYRWPVNSPLKGPVTRKIFPFDDVIMFSLAFYVENRCRNLIRFWVETVASLAAGAIPTEPITEQPTLYLLHV